MLTLITNSGAVPLHIDDYYVKHLASGLDELIFNVNIWDEEYQLIQEESSIQENSGSPINYLVKAIDGGKSTATVKAQIDLDEWKSTMTVAYNSGSNSVSGIVRSVVPDGWTVVDTTTLTYLRTIHLDSATALDVLNQCKSTFSGVTFRFDNVTKTVTIINMDTFTSIGAFVTRDLNLKQNNYKGKSTGFTTRLYAYGKDNLSFADINDGKEYIDNNTYSSRVICGYWKDERYTAKESLLAAAQKRLEGMAVPQRSYECDVVDLAATDPVKYSYLDFQLFTTVTLIDHTRSNTRINHQVVELWEYPYLPQKNKVVLSTVAPKIQTQLTQVVQSLTDPNSDFLQAQKSAIERATDAITGQSGGYIRNIYVDDIWTEQVIMDTDDIETATKVWRFNLGGLGYSSHGYNGPYSTAITQDGEIVANFITAGELDCSKFTVKNLDAGAITTGTLDASDITVTNLNAASITAGYLNVDRIESASLTGAKIAVNTITGGYSGNISLATISTANTVSGIVTSLGYADFSNSVFNNASRCSYLYTEYLDAGTTGRIATGSIGSLLVGHGSSYWSATWGSISVTHSFASAFKVYDINGNEQWVSNLDPTGYSNSDVLEH